jgi:hypothetical protein
MSRSGCGASRLLSVGFEAVFVLILLRLACKRRERGS